MTDHKFTDDEIIHSLKVCLNDGDCSECLINPHKGNYGYCTSLAIKAALDLINRQKAEIERLIACIDSASAFLEEQHKRRTQEHKVQMEKLDQIKEQIPLALARAKAEAIKDFAERLKKEINVRTTLSKEQDKNILFYIDTLVKEMTEGKENESKNT